MTSVPCISIPFAVIMPLAGKYNPRMRFKSVVFPAPFSPTMAYFLPFCSESEIPFSAQVSLAG